MRQGLESRGLLGKERQTWGPHLTALLATQAPRRTLSQGAGFKVPLLRQVKCDLEHSNLPSLTGLFMQEIPTSAPEASGRTK